MRGRYYPNNHHRRSVRLGRYDYSQAGAYFVTLVTQGRECLFGEVEDCKMRLNEAGEMARAVWGRLPDRFPNVEVENFVVMPNHIHAIVVISDVGAPLVGAQSYTPGTASKHNGATTRVAPTLGEVIGAFKSLTTVEYTRGVRNEGWPAFQKRLWQRNYYEHIVRSDDSLLRIIEYIITNPANWDQDSENPSHLASVLGHP